MEAPTVGIGRLLKEGGRFFVPNHQRDYSWTEDEIEQLLQDISEARRTSQKEYFIGLMVFMPRANREYIILDGQQRLATAVILLAAIRSWLKAHNFDRDAEQIQRQCIASRELGRDDEKSTVVLNENNNSSFARFVVREAPVTEIETELSRLKRYDPDRRLLEAAVYCRKYIDVVARADREEGSRARALFDLVGYLEDAVKVVRLNVPSEANAYTVFETLNARGLDLSVLDLAKNHLFGRATSPDRLRDVQTQWGQMMANLINFRADDFLKTWWTSRCGRVQTPQLFSAFKAKVVSEGDAVSVSEDMLSASEKYAALEVADDPQWAGLPEESKQSIRALKLLGAQQTHPVLLSALERLAEPEIARLLRLLEVLIVRYQLIGGGRTGRLEIACARLAHRIFNKECGTATAALDLLKDVYPSDDEFREYFRSKQERNNQKARYLLIELERAARRTESRPGGEELEPRAALTLEHILPRSPDASWDETLSIDTSLADDCTYRLGNLCLLNKINKSLGSRSFSDKKGVFRASGLSLTCDLADVQVWNRESIERRQERLAKLAVNHWRF